MTYTVLTVAIILFVLLRTRWRPASLRIHVEESLAESKSRYTRVEWDDDDDDFVQPLHEAAVDHVDSGISIAEHEANHRLVAPAATTRLASIYRTIYGPGLCSPR